jgi:hypothetical protein
MLQPVTSALLLNFRQLLISRRSRSSRILYKNMGNKGCPGPITELSPTWLFAVTSVTKCLLCRPQMLYGCELQLCNRVAALSAFCYNLLQTVTFCYSYLLHFVTEIKNYHSVSYKICNSYPSKNSYSAKIFENPKTAPYA